MAIYRLITNNLIVACAYGIALLIVGRIFSNTSARAYDAYQPGISHDRGASLFALSSLMARGVGAFLIITVCLSAGLMHGPKMFASLHNTPATVNRLSFANEIVSVFDQHLTAAEEGLIPEANGPPEDTTYVLQTNNTSIK